MLLPWKHLVLIVVTIILVYGKAPFFDFVTYDDYDLVVDNQPYLANQSNILTSFTTHIFSTHRAESAYYRPLLMLSFMADYRLWGLNPLGYHLINLLLHCATTIALYVLARLCFADGLPPLVASLLFAVHPAQVESVAWVSGSNDLLLGFFVVLMVVAYSRIGAAPHRDKLYSFLAVGFFALALLTKESAAFYIFLPIALDLSAGRMQARDILSLRGLKRILPFGIVLVAYLAIRYAVLGAVVGAEKLYGSTPLGVRLQQVPGVIAQYCSLLVAPVHLSVVHPLDTAFWLRPVWSRIALAFPVCLLAALWLAWRRDRIVWFGLAWFAMGLIPVLDIIPVAVPILEHRLYLPMAGFALALSRTVFLLKPSGAGRKLASAIATAVTLLWAILSFLRLPVWQNSETLWSDAIAKEPADSRSYFNLAGYYFNRQEYARSIPLVEEFVRLNPQSAIGYSKLRQLYFMTGRYADAVRVCRTMIEADPHNGSRYVETGQLFERLNEPDSAVAVYRQGIAEDPKDYRLFERLGILLMAEGKRADAESPLLAAIRLAPGDGGPYFALGDLYGASQRDSLAIASIQEGMKITPPPAATLKLLESLYNRTGREEEARNLHRRYNY